MPITNILIIAFVALMFYLWSIQGAFSAFLHCVITIIAGALAFAVWEPVAVGLLMGKIPAYAWTVGLMVPFALILLIIRQISDNLVKGKLDFSQTVNTAVGGAFGLISGILTAGITIIALGFMPMERDLGGYEPFKNYDPQGQVIGKAGDGLLIPVDRYTAGLYNMLSNGALSCATPMAIYQPDVARQASVHRLGRGNNSSNVVEPDVITLNKMYIPELPITKVSDEIPQDIRNMLSDANRKIVIIDSTWRDQTENGAYIDGVLNVSTTQIQLVTTASKSSHGRLYHPIAAAQTKSGSNRVFLPFASDPGSFVNNEGASKTSFASIFSIPTNETPKFILYRHLRFELPSEKKAVSDINLINEIAGLAGSTKTPEQLAKEAAAKQARDKANQQSKIGARSGVKTGTEAVNIEVSTFIPTTITSGVISGLKLNNDKQIVSGSGDIKKMPGISRRNRVDNIALNNPYMNCVRVELAQDKVHSLYGQANAAAAKLGPCRLWRSRSGLSCCHPLSSVQI